MTEQQYKHEIKIALKSHNKSGIKNLMRNYFRKYHEVNEQITRKSDDAHKIFDGGLL